MTRRIRRWGDNPQVVQGLFGGALILGVAGIVLLKLNGADQLLVTAWPVLVMIAYTALVFIPPFTLRPDQTGDNVYYLGFLYTLTSLAYSLYQFSVSAGVEQIVQNFGIAVATTIVGVAGRVLLNQMRLDPYETERASRLALSDASKNLRGELDASVLEFNTYRRQVQQAAADGIRELRNIAASQLEHTSGELGSTITTTTQRIEAVMAEWLTSAENWKGQSAELVGAMSTLSTRLEAVRAPASIIEEKLAPTAEALTSLAASSTAAAVQLESVVSRLERGATDVGGIATAASEILAAARMQSEALLEAGNLAQRAAQELARMESAGERLEANLGSVAAELTRSLTGFAERLDGQLAQARELSLEDRERVAQIMKIELSAFIDRLEKQVYRQPAGVGR